MNRLILSAAILSIIALTQCEKPEQSHDIEGTISGVDSDTVVVISSGAEGYSNMDTIAIPGGIFKYNVPTDIPVTVNILPVPKFDATFSPAMSMGPGDILYGPNDKLQIEFKLGQGENSKKVSGSILYDAKNQFETDIIPFKEKQDKILDVISDLPRETTAKETYDSMYQLVRDVESEITAKRKEFIRNHPDHQLSGFFFNYIEVDSILHYYELIADTVKNGQFSDNIDRAHKYYFKKMAMVELKEGMDSPDFNLEDSDGNPFQLSSLRGKYVVLDFWGVWCTWCVKGFPKMKEYYSKVSDKIEFVGVDCGDTKEKWQKGLAEYELPWINVYFDENSKDLVPSRFGVNAFPTKIIITPEGKVFKYLVGESDVFYEELDKIMSM